MAVDGVVGVKGSIGKSDALPGTEREGKELSWLSVFHIT